VDVQGQDILQQVREAAAKRILFLPHAVNQMNSPERMISTREVRAVLSAGVVIEDYPADVRGHSCLLLGWGEEGRPIHVVCAPKPEYVAVITTYLPSAEQWETDWRTRREG
jgi:homoserine kinase